ncbi:barstar family protein [Micromonospora tulbaghiae]|uniref:barstar family protein n=1 Tax=Micromonospora tulbaghiae TaxID=479978 RepID=UPI00341DC1BC
MCLSPRVDRCVGTDRARALPRREAHRWRSCQQGRVRTYALGNRRPRGANRSRRSPTPGRALDFGPYYGANLDALWDRLSRDAPRPVAVVWTDWQVSESNLGARRFERICCLLRAVEAEDREASHEELFTFELR